ncbi:MAG: hypothetical protein SFX73_33865 [Kofleriaceae bacterium]|nr:hypothetical protein [Kofleriaceae bacterium]
MPSRWLAALVLTAACYDPAPRAACSVACDYVGQGAAAACPGELVCGVQGLCVGATTDRCDPVDGGPAGDAPRCFAPPPVSGLMGQICFTDPPADVLVLPTAIDTTTCQLGADAPAGTATFCIISARELRVPTQGVATGDRPLILLASEAIIIEATGGIDVSSRRGQPIGAGGNWGVCEGSIIQAVGGAGGGAGGTFQGRGGNGAGSLGGTRAVNSLELAFHGGCPGGDGGQSDARGGRGGGAMFLSAPRIEVYGHLIAAGEGGGTATGMNRGGGGGGSGGFIGVHAGSLLLDLGARLVAAGGGGGGASESDLGAPGQDPTVENPAAMGGTGFARGGNGSQPLQGEDGAVVSDIGGGGGGGAGYIDLRSGGAAIECFAPRCVPASSL